MKRGICTILTSIVSIIMLSTTAFSLTSTVGYFRASFLKDPLLYNFFEEHMSVSQVLDTLVSTNSQGDIAPCIAERWEVMDGGKTYRFHIRGDAFFSDGKPIMAEDVKYSLDRHISSSTSQSGPFLQDIESLSAVSPRELSHKHNRALLEVEFGDIAEADLKNIVGDGTEEIIDELIEADVVIREGDKIRQKYENIHVSSLSFAKIRATIFLDAADLKFRGTKLHNFNKRLNAEGQRRVYGVLDKAEQDLAEIQRDQSLHGDIKVGASFIMTTI